MNFRDDEHRAAVWAGLAVSVRAVSGNRTDRMRSVAGLLWDALAPLGVSWIGFYEIAGPGNEHGAEPGGEMILGPHRDRPACSPIGLHGACGRSWRERVSLVVGDVAALGEGYVACNPRDLAEIVVPCLDEAGSCWGVLDGDSFERGCFDSDDAARLHGLLTEGGLTAGRPPEIITI